MGWEESRSDQALGLPRLCGREENGRVIAPTSLPLLLLLLLLVFALLRRPALHGLRGAQGPNTAFLFQGSEAWGRGRGKKESGEERGKILRGQA